LTRIHRSRKPCLSPEFLSRQTRAVPIETAASRNRPRAVARLGGPRHGARDSRRRRVARSGRGRTAGQVLVDRLAPASSGRRLAIIASQPHPPSSPLGTAAHRGTMIALAGAPAQHHRPS
jgi:hypothetical protein